MVKVKGAIVGMDFVSSSKAYRRLHRKLVGSYSMDAVLGFKRGSSSLSDPASFLEEIKKCQVEVFNSVGYGHDYRFSRGKVVGSALIYGQTVIHGAFFALESGRENENDNFANVDRRRSWRRKRGSTINIDD